MLHVGSLALSLLYTSNSKPVGGLPVLLSWAIIVGGCYGVIRLALDVLMLIIRAGNRPAPEQASDPGSRKTPHG